MITVLVYALKLEIAKTKFYDIGHKTIPNARISIYGKQIT